MIFGTEINNGYSVLFLKMRRKIQALLPKVFFVLDAYSVSVA